MRQSLWIGVTFGHSGAASAEPQTGSDAQAKLDKLLEGRVEGRPKRCLPVRQILHPTGIDEGTLVFRDGPRIWVNRLSAGVECEKLDKLSQVAFESGAAGLVCSGHLLQFSNGPLQGACELGEFIPFTKR